MDGLLKKVKEGQQIKFSYLNVDYKGVITEIIPMTKVWKYIIAEPTEISTGEVNNPLWLYDGEEEEWQVSL